MVKYTSCLWDAIKQRSIQVLYSSRFEIPKQERAVPHLTPHPRQVERDAKAYNTETSRRLLASREVKYGPTHIRTAQSSGWLKIFYVADIHYTYNIRARPTSGCTTENIIRPRKYYHKTRRDANSAAPPLSVYVNVLDNPPSLCVCIIY